MKKETIQGTTERKTKLKNGGKVALAALAFTGMGIADMACSPQPTYNQDQVNGIVDKAVNKALTDYQNKQPQPQQPNIIYANPNVVTQPYQPETVYQPEYAGDFPHNQQEAANTWGYDDFTRNPWNWNQISGGWSCVSDSNRQFNLSRFGVDGSRREYNNGYQYNYGRHGYWNNGQWYESYDNGGPEVGVVAFNTGVITLKGGSFYRIENQQEAYDLYNKVVSYHPGTTIRREGF